MATLVMITLDDLYAEKREEILEAILEESGLDAEDGDSHDFTIQLRITDEEVEIS